MRPRPPSAAGRTAWGRMHGLDERAAWQILNAAFTMFTTRLLGNRMRPSRGGTGRSMDVWGGSAVGGAGQVRRRQLDRAAPRGEQLARLVGRHRLAEIPTLADRAAESHDCLIGSFILDPLDAHRDRQGPCQRRDGADDRNALALGVKVADETAVDLDDVERQRLQMRERREASAE